MDLTRVRVRGKRRAPGTNRPVALFTRSNRKTRKRSLAAVMTSHAMRSCQTLDSLPTEILERILLYSANLSLPRVSNLVGMKLSGRATLLRLFIWAFHETWDQWFGIPNDPAVLHGPWLAGVRPVPCDGDYVFQSEVLSQPWINMDLILQAQQTWADHYGQGRWYQHSIPWHEDPSQVDHDREGGFSHFNARECFEADYQQALEWPAFRVQTVSWCTQDIHPMACIPTKLITGPWDEEMQRRLFWLCRGGFMSNGQSCSPPTWEDKIELLRNAILNVSEPNVLVTNCLLRNWVFEGLPADVARREFVGLERRLDWGADTQEGREILRRTRNALYLALQLPDPAEETWL